MSFIETTAQLNGLVSRLSKARHIAVDTETTGLNWKTDTMLGLSFADSAKEGHFLFLPKPKDRVKIAKILADPHISKVFHNAKFDMHFLREAGMPVHGEVHDTYILAKLWNENLPNHKLKPLARLLLGEAAGAEQDELKEWMEKNGKGWGELKSVPKTLLARYGAKDTAITLGVEGALMGHLEEQEIPEALIKREWAVLRKAYEMERRGAVVNKAFLEKYKKELQGEQDTLLKDMYTWTGQPFNPESDADVLAAFVKLGVKISEKKTDTGKQSADKRVIEGIDHTLAKVLLEHRRIGTIRSTFVAGILDRAVKRDDGWTVHTNYNTAAASTGRWSSNDPNLQNVDKKSKAREAFVPRKGMEFWMLDYKQIEPTLFAHFGSARLRKAFQDGLDYHTFNAAAAFGVAYEDVTPEQRKTAKGLGLAVLYQAGAAQAARMMGVELSAGRRIISTYQGNFPEVKAFQRKVTDKIEERAVEVAKDAGRIRIKSRDDWWYHADTCREYAADRAKLAAKFPDDRGLQKEAAAWAEAVLSPEENGLLPLPMREVYNWEDPAKPWFFVDKNVITEYGWVQDPFGRIYRLQIKDAYKGLNRLIQGTAAGVLKEAMVRCPHQPLLQVHDELVFEFPKGKGKAMALEAKAAMESLQEMFPQVPIKVDVARATKNWAHEEEVKL